MKIPESLQKLRQQKAVLYGALACCALFACYQLYSNITYEPKITKEIPLVRTITVGAAAESGSKTYPGEVRGRYESSLAFQVAGKINARYVNIGDRVTAGQVLMTIDPKDVLQNVEAAEAALSAAVSSQQLAADNARRYGSLYQSGAVSQAVYDSYLVQLDAADAQLRQAQAQTSVSYNQLEYTRLRSDADGVVASLSGEIGQVTAAGTPMATVVKSGAYEVQIFVPESSLKEIKLGEAAAVTLWALPDIQLQGTVAEIAPMADSVTRTYRVRVALDKLPEAVKLGMTAKVVLATAEPAAGTFIVPASALYQVNGKTQLWLARDNKAVLADVSVKNYRQNQLLVTGGLRPGDTVITAGLAKLTENQEIRLENAAGGKEGEQP